MKIYFTITALAATIDASIDNIEMNIEKNWYRLEELLPLCDGQPVFAQIGGTTSPVIGVWINIPVEIQGIRTTIEGASTVLTFEELNSSTKYVAYKNFNRIDVAQWQEGRCYLIPFTAGAPTDMIPSTQIVPVEKAIDLVFTGSHYPYRATTNLNVRKGITFNAVVFELQLLDAIQATADKSKGKASEELAFASSNLRRS